MNPKTAGLIGLARKAGKCLLGYDSICSAKQSTIYLILSACDCSDRAQRLISSIACPRIRLDLDRWELGKLLGAREVALVAVTDKNFAAGISSKFSDDGGN